MLNFEWAFCNKEEVIKNYINGTVFDDAEIDELIIIGEENSSLKLSTREFFSQNIGLPFSLIPLVDEDIDNYLKYKEGIKRIIPKDRNIEFMKITSLEGQYKRQRKR